MRALTEALVDRAAGRLTDADLAKVASLHRSLEDGFEKSAAPGAGAASAIGQRLLEAFGRGVEHSVPLIVAGLGVTGAAAGGRALMDKATKGRDLDKILEVYPHLKKWDRREIELAYNSMRHMNPHIAKDPLAGGTLLGQMLRSRDPLDPKALRFEPQLAGDLLRLNPREEHAFEEVARDAILKGVGSAMDDMSRERAGRTQQAFAREQEEGRRAFDRERDLSRAEREERHRREDAAEERRSKALDQRRKAELERAKHEWARGGKWEEQKWKREDEDSRRQWQTGQSATDQSAQDRRAVMSALLSKAGPDSAFHPIVDQTTGLPIPGMAQHSAPPTISSVLQQHYPGLRP